MRHLCIKTIILPRLARDKHRLGKAQNKTCLCIAGFVTRKRFSEFDLLHKLVKVNFTLNASSCTILY